ncbi:unnamed protein product [Sympodiomycopsis kandeliae]
MSLSRSSSSSSLSSVAAMAYPYAGMPVFGSQGAVPGAAFAVSEAALLEYNGIMMAAEARGYTIQDAIESYNSVLAQYEGSQAVDDAEGDDEGDAEEAAAEEEEEEEEEEGEAAAAAEEQEAAETATSQQAKIDAAIQEYNAVLALHRGSQEGLDEDSDSDVELLVARPSKRRFPRTVLSDSDEQNYDDDSDSDIPLAVSTIAKGKGKATEAQVARMAKRARHDDDEAEDEDDIPLYILEESRRMARAPRTSGSGGDGASGSGSGSRGNDHGSGGGPTHVDNHNPNDDDNHNHDHDHNDSSSSDNNDDSSDEDSDDGFEPDDEALFNYIEEVPENNVNNQALLIEEWAAEVPLSKWPKQVTMKDLPLVVAPWDSELFFWRHSRHCFGKMNQNTIPPVKLIRETQRIFFEVQLLRIKATIQDGAMSEDDWARRLRPWINKQDWESVVVMTMPGTSAQRQQLRYTQGDLIGHVIRAARGTNLQAAAIKLLGQSIHPTIKDYIRTKLHGPVAPALPKLDFTGSRTRRRTGTSGAQARLDRSDESDKVCASFSALRAAVLASNNAAAGLEAAYFAEILAFMLSTCMLQSVETGNLGFTIFFQNFSAEQVAKWIVKLCKARSKLWRLRINDVFAPAEWEQILLIKEQYSEELSTGWSTKREDAEHVGSVKTYFKIRAREAMRRARVERTHKDFKAKQRQVYQDARRLWDESHACKSCGIQMKTFVAGFRPYDPHRPRAQWVSAENASIDAIVPRVSVACWRCLRIRNAECPASVWCLQRRKASSHHGAAGTDPCRAMIRGPHSQLVNGFYSARAPPVRPSSAAINDGNAVALARRWLNQRARKYAEQPRKRGNVTLQDLWLSFALAWSQQTHSVVKSRVASLLSRTSPSTASIRGKGTMQATCAVYCL